METGQESEWYKAHMQRQRAEWDALQPLFEKFRATPEEQCAKAKEDEAEAAFVEQSRSMPPEFAKVFLFGQDIARSAREGVRFQRWRYPDIYSN